jgi:hypothetical protein
MRGEDSQTGSLSSYVSCEARVPTDHPLRTIRAIVDEAPGIFHQPAKHPVPAATGAPGRHARKAWSIPAAAEIHHRW